jgi:predicted nucleic-acid-binding Zn-ribbon protein
MASASWRTRASNASTSVRSATALGLGLCSTALVYSMRCAVSAPRDPARAREIGDSIFSMRDTHVCPKCQFRKVWRISPIELARQIPLQIDAAKLARLGLGTLREIKSDAPVHGFEVYVCARCGFTECYATTFDEIERAGTLLEAEPGDAYR